MSEPAGPFKVILHSVDDMWNSRVRSEVSRLFQIDDDTASNIVSAIPIVVIDGLDARTAGIVRERIRPLSATGCRVITTDDPADTIPRVNWPEVPEIARVPDDAVPTGAAPVAGSSEPPIAVFQCPSCGQSLHVSRTSSPRDREGRGAQVGALAKPGASAPSEHAKPGANGSDATPVETRGRESRAEASPRATASAEKDPVPTLTGDEWLDPPIPRSTKKLAPAQASSVASSASPERAPPPPAPAPPPTPASAMPRAAAASAHSLLDDPLLAVKNPSFASAPSASAGAGAPSDVTTLSAKPITSRFSRSTPTPVQARAAAAGAAPPPPTTRPQPPPPSGTGRFAPPPAPASAPPPRPAPPPSKMMAAPRSSGGASNPDLEELDVHFDEASDLEAAAKLPRQKGKREEERPPSGVDDEENPSASGRHKLPPPAPKEDELLFDEESSRSGHRARPEESAADLLDEPISTSSSSKSGKKKSAPSKKASESEQLSLSPSDDDDMELLESSSSKTKSRGAKNTPALRPDSDDPDGDLFVVADDDELSPPTKGKKPSKGAFDASEQTGDDDDDDDDLELMPPPSTSKGKKGKAPQKQDFEGALGLFESGDAAPVDDGRGLQPSRGGRKDDVPEIEPIDLASPSAQVSATSASASGKKRAAADDPFDKRSSSAILEPLDPNEAMAILKEQNDPPPPSSRGGGSRKSTLPEDEPSSRSGARGRPSGSEPDASSPNLDDDEPPVASGDLEPLDPNEALAILGTDDEPQKAPPKKSSRPKNGRRSEGSKLVPLSASDEDFDFLDESKGKGKAQGRGAGGKTDPFARARGSELADDTQGVSSKGKKSADPFAKGRESDDEASPPSKSGGGRATRDKGMAASGGPPSKKGSMSNLAGPVVDGDGDHGLVLSRITTESKRQKAAELIAEIKGVPFDEALKLTDRTIIPVLKGVSRDVAEHHLEKFKRNKIPGRVTTRQKDR